MSFWTETDASAIQDPKRKFRWYVLMMGLGMDNATAWWAKSINKPSFTIAPTEHKYLNHTYYYPGSVTWNEISMVIVDPVSPDTSATLASIVQASGYTIPAGVAPPGLQTMSKSKSVAALGAVFIVQVDSSGNPLETWTLNNPWITDVQYGDLAYGTDDLIEVTLKMRYDWASMKVTTEGSVGDTADNAPGQTDFFNI